jgi:hypothetical protein
MSDTVRDNSLAVIRGKELIEARRRRHAEAVLSAKSIIAIQSSPAKAWE